MLVGGGDDQEQNPKLNRLKVNVALSSRGKGKLIDGSDLEEEDENEKLRRKIHRDKIDENLRIVREADGKKGLLDEHKYEPIVMYLKRVSISYIQEVEKMDVEIAAVLRKKPIVLPKGALENFDKMKLDIIRKDGWCMAFQIREKSDVEFHRVCFSLADKHLYSTSCLKYNMELMNQCKANNSRDKKCFLNMINGYIHVCKTLRGIMLKLFVVKKRQQQ
ncbi:unnamed protein product [Lactuca saligna]|uniref:Uncharacterized protein n=1 Tax=Lactuca saligna TaxID=75948 RepID=A0AA35V019_LACSI|nr:unnamed protein product [Lactuca saligna]